MDPELRDLHRGAREERRRLTPDPEPCPDPEPDAEPVDVGDVYRWNLGGYVKIAGMWIDEDGNAQVRVIDRGEKRSIDAETVHDLVNGGAFDAVGKARDHPDEPWWEKREAHVDG